MYRCCRWYHIPVIVEVLVTDEFRYECSSDFQRNTGSHVVVIITVISYKLETGRVF